jgi:hypothetical protein
MSAFRNVQRAFETDAFLSADNFQSMVMGHSEGNDLLTPIIAPLHCGKSFSRRPTCVLMDFLQKKKEKRSKIPDDPPLRNSVLGSLI